MRFLEYLFFKYYNWSIKVGDSDIPAITSLCCMAFGFILYFIDIVAFFVFFLQIHFSIFYLYLFVCFSIALIIVLYIILVAKGKDEIIMEKHKEEWKGKKHIGAVLFPIIAFLVFCIEVVIKMQMNRRMLGLLL